MVKFSWVLFFGLFVSTPSWGQVCLAPDQVAEVRQLIRFETWNDNSKTWVELSDFQACGANTFAYKIIEGVIGLKNLPSLTTRRDDFDRGVITGTPFQFFAERAQVIRLDTDPNSRNCDARNNGTRAYVLDGNSHTLYFCPYSMTLTPLAMQGTFVHEAHHLFEDANPNAETAAVAARPHELCKIGFFADTLSCDESPSVAGSYGVEVEFYLKLARTESLPSELRSRALGLANEVILGHFNSLPAGGVGMLLQTDDDTLYFYEEDKQKLTEVRNHIAATEVIADRAMISIFDTADNTVESFISAGLTAPAYGEMAERFRQLPAERAAQLRDVAYGRYNHCMLFADSITCSQGGAQNTIPFPESFRASQFSILRGFPNDMFFVVTEDGRQFRLPTDFPIQEWDFAKLVEHNLGDIHSFIIMPGLKRFAISSNGTLARISKDNALEPVQAFKDLRFKKIIGPIMWSASLLNIY